MREKKRHVSLSLEVQGECERKKACVFLSGSSRILRDRKKTRFLCLGVHEECEREEKTRFLCLEVHEECEREKRHVSLSGSS